MSDFIIFYTEESDFMSFKEILPIAIAVLKDFRVIGTVLAMLFVISFANYIIRYKKKPPKPKVKKAKAAPAPKPEPKKEEGGENENGAEGE